MTRRAAGCGRWSNLRGGGGERRADRGQPMRAARRRLHGGGKAGGALAVGDLGPTDRNRDLVGVRPFEDQSLDPARRGGDRPRSAAGRRRRGRCRHAAGCTNRRSRWRKRRCASTTASGGGMRRAARATPQAIRQSAKKRAHIQSLVPKGREARNVRSRRCGDSLLRRRPWRYKLTCGRSGGSEEKDDCRHAPGWRSA